MALMKRAADALSVDTKRFKERAILSAISHAKSELISAVRLRRAATRLLRARSSRRVYERYQDLLAENNAARLRRPDPEDASSCSATTSEMREKYQERFLHVLVDEFQDTNVAQYQLARLLRRRSTATSASSATPTSRSTRGARPTSATSSTSSATFRRRASSCSSRTTARRRTSSTRRTPSSPAASSARRSRSGREQGGGEPIVAYEAYDEAEEADFVANEISGLLDDGHERCATSP